MCDLAGEYRSCRGAVLCCGGMGPAGPGQHSAGRVLWDGNHRHLSGQGDSVVCNGNLVHDFSLLFSFFFLNAVKLNTTTAMHSSAKADRCALKRAVLSVETVVLACFRQLCSLLSLEGKEGDWNRNVP